MTDSNAKGPTLSPISITGKDADRITLTVHLKDMVTPDLRELILALGFIRQGNADGYVGRMAELAAFAGVMRAAGMYAVTESSRQPGAVFKRGDPVEKVTGDYAFPGHVVAVVVKLGGALRYVVEDDRGALHIFNAGQLRVRKVSKLGDTVKGLG